MNRSKKRLRNDSTNAGPSEPLIKTESSFGSGLLSNYSFDAFDSSRFGESDEDEGECHWEEFSYVEIILHKESPDPIIVEAFLPLHIDGKYYKTDKRHKNSPVFEHESGKFVICRGYEKHLFYVQEDCEKEDPPHILIHELSYGLWYLHMRDSVYLQVLGKEDGLEFDFHLSDDVRKQSNNLEIIEKAFKRHAHPGMDEAYLTTRKWNRSFGFDEELSQEVHKLLSETPLLPGDLVTMSAKQRKEYLNRNNSESDSDNIDKVPSPPELQGPSRYPSNISGRSVANSISSGGGRLPDMISSRYGIEHIEPMRPSKFQSSQKIPEPTRFSRISEVKETPHVKRWRRGDFTMINQYLVIRHIKKGSYGSVELCANVLEDLKIVAMKVIDADVLNKHTFLRGKRDAQKNTKEWDNALRELDLMRLMRLKTHRNVVNLYEVIDDPEHQRIYIIMEYCNGGDLSDVIAKGILPLPEFRDIFTQLLCGLEYLHTETRIVHCDLKPDNILIQNIYQDGELKRVVKLADFNVSHNLSKVSHLTFVDGSLPYQAPESLPSVAYQSPESFPDKTPDLEVMNNEFRAWPVDIWAAACCGLELLTGRPEFAPYKEIPWAEITHNICFKEPEYPEHTPGNLKDLFQHMFDKDPNKRYTMEQIKEHSWTQEAEWPNDVEQAPANMDVYEKQPSSFIRKPSETFRMINKVNTRLKELSMKAKAKRKQSMKAKAKRKQAMMMKELLQEEKYMKDGMFTLPNSIIPSTDLDDALNSSGCTLISKVYDVQAPHIPGLTVFNASGLTNASIRAMIWDFIGLNFEFTLPITDCSPTELVHILEEIINNYGVPMEWSSFFRSTADIILSFLGMDELPRIYLVQSGGNLDGGGVLEMKVAKENTQYTATFDVSRFSKFAVVRCKAAALSMYYSDETESLGFLMCSDVLLRDEQNASILHNKEHIAHHLNQLDTISKDENLTPYQRELISKKKSAAKYVLDGCDSLVQYTANNIPLLFQNGPRKTKFSCRFEIEFLDLNNRLIMRTQKYTFEEGFGCPIFDVLTKEDVKKLHSFKINISMSRIDWPNGFNSADIKVLGPFTVYNSILREITEDFRRKRCPSKSVPSRSQRQSIIHGLYHVRIKPLEMSSSVGGASLLSLEIEGALEPEQEMVM